MFFTTSNSKYEIDLEKCQIRRLEGIANPTPRQGPDGEWKRYLTLSDVRVGQEVLIGWELDGVLKATMTSPVTSVQED